MRVSTITVAAILSIFSAVSSAAAGLSLCEREMSQAAKKYEIPLGILYAVGLTETGIDGRLHAFALNLEGDTVYSLGKEQAILRFHAARASGLKLIDVGCMQINYYFHNNQFATIEDMFDPHKNVDYAARFLKELHQREGSWTLAVARYNAGKDNTPAQKRYVCRVLARLAESGFGAWTPRSKAFCEGEPGRPKPAKPEAPQAVDSQSRASSLSD